jgi:hypothetical protein
MSPACVAKYICNEFGNNKSAVKVTVLNDPEKIRNEYPLMAAVSRCANAVEEHKV